MSDLLSIDLRMNIATGKFLVATNVKQKHLSDLLCEYLQGCLGAGADERKPEPRDIYTIRLRVDLSCDKFTVESDTGNDGLREGIIGALVNALENKPERIEWVDKLPDEPDVVKVVADAFAVVVERLTEFKKMEEMNVIIAIASTIKLWNDMLKTGPKGTPLETATALDNLLNGRAQVQSESDKELIIQFQLSRPDTATAMQRTVTWLVEVCKTGAPPHDILKLIDRE